MSEDSPRLRIELRNEFGKEKQITGPGIEPSVNLKIENMADHEILAQHVILYGKMHPTVFTHYANIYAILKRGLRMRIRNIITHWRWFAYTHTHTQTKLSSINIDTIQYTAY